ncbi:MAG: flippase-like domain-containing protein [Magnetococcales bacterium]|nr:flippase-like domain-containing protein [Magnetococcales bacterium]
MKQTWWQRVWPLIKLGASATLIGLLWYQGKLDFSALWLLSSSPWTIVLAVLFSTASYSLGALRWIVLLRSQRIVLPLIWGHKVTYLSLYCNLVLPGGGMAGDAIRLAQVIRVAPQQRLEGFLSLFVDRAVGLYGMLFIALLAILSNPDVVTDIGPLRLMAGVVLGAVLGIPVGAVVFYHLLHFLTEKAWFVRLLASGGRFGALLGRLMDIVRLYRNALPQLLLALLLTVLLQGLLLSGLVLVAVSMELGSLTPLDYTFATPWAWMANFLPLTPGGIGVGEATFDQVCRWLESTPSGAPYGTIFLMYRLLSMLGSFPGLVIFFFDRKEVQAVVREPENGF